MGRYYDHLSISCRGCVYFAGGEFPSGEPYKCCRLFGYIFHEEKGVSPEECAGCRTEEQVREMERIRHINTRYKRR